VVKERVCKITESTFTIYDTIEIVGGLIGGLVALIGIIIVFASGIFSGTSFLQILSAKCNIIMALGVGGVGIAAIYIMISRFLQTTKTLLENKS
jgi:uncharacterized membrane protein